MEVVVTAGAIRRVKFQSEQANTKFFYRPDALPVYPTDSIKALKGNLH